MPPTKNKDAKPDERSAARGSEAIIEAADTHIGNIAEKYCKAIEKAKQPNIKAHMERIRNSMLECKAALEDEERPNRSSAQEIDLKIFDHLALDEKTLESDDIYDVLGATIKITNEMISLFDAVGTIKAAEYGNNDIKDTLDRAKSCIVRVKREAEEGLSEIIGKEW
ncbi:MAG: hypothetical protein M1360_01570 [Candidatus Marsarchaeota archaeon]|jgi:hypothetical protein|nr:hypothetical protein [Candidatus Marsarchaeota archaeon]MCL5418610.1 hypothetical protein [Candidatus Marsarchaeota archaeon]